MNPLGYLRLRGKERALGGCPPEGVGLVCRGATSNRAINEVSRDAGPCFDTGT